MMIYLDGFRAFLQVALALAGAVFAIVGAVLTPSVVYQIRRSISSERSKGGRPPKEQPRILWTLFWVSLSTMAVYPIITIGLDQIEEAIATANSEVDWVKISDAKQIRFSLGTLAGSVSGRNIFLDGDVFGIVSNSQMSVFLLVQRRLPCDVEELTLVMPDSSSCLDEPDYPYWNISEAVVSADGDWRASPCSYPFRYDTDAPDFEYWEFLAISTMDRSSVIDHIIHQVCAISAKDLRSISALICSETQIIIRPPEVGGYYIDASWTPTSQKYCQ